MHNAKFEFHTECTTYQSYKVFTLKVQNSKLEFHAQCTKYQSYIIFTLNVLNAIFKFPTLGGCLVTSLFWSMSDLCARKMPKAKQKRGTTAKPCQLPKRWRCALLDIGSTHLLWITGIFKQFVLLKNISNRINHKCTIYRVDGVDAAQETERNSQVCCLAQLCLAAA